MIHALTRSGMNSGMACGRAMRALRRALLGAGVAAATSLSPAALAAPECSFSTTTSVNFGVYDVFAAGANNNGVGRVNIRCKGGNGAFVVALGTGQSNSYLSRVMSSGPNRLNYNLYTSAARNTVWGDGSGGSSVLTADGNSTTRLSVFGQIPAGQDASVGNYTDTIIATVTF